MQYRSVADLNAALFGNLSKLPDQIDVIVGIPRSGLLVANLLSLAINVPMTDLEGFLEGRILSSGRTKLTAELARELDFNSRILLIDDSVNSGRAMAEAVALLAKSPFKGRMTTCAVYGLTDSHKGIDIILEVVPQPRLFQWNFLHHPVLEEAC